MGHRHLLSLFLLFSCLLGALSACTIPTETLGALGAGTTTFCTGTYYLNTSSATVTASNSVLDCNGSTFIGNGTTNSLLLGSYTGKGNITVKNCIIGGGYHIGMLFTLDENATFINNTLYGTYENPSTGGGFYLNRDTNFTIINSTFRDTNAAVKIDYYLVGGNLTFFNDTFYNFSSSTFLSVANDMTGFVIANSSFKDNPIVSTSTMINSLRIENSSLQNASVRMTPSSMSNFVYRYNHNYNGSAQIDIRNQQNTLVDSNLFENIDDPGCSGGSSKCVAILLLNASGMTVNNNTIVNSTDTGFATGVSVGGSNILLNKTTCQKTSLCAALTGGATCPAGINNNVTVSFTTVNQTGLSTSLSLHGIGMWCANNSVAYNNTLTDGTYGILFEYHTRNCSIYNNSIYNYTFPIYDLHDNYNNAAWGNSIYNTLGNYPGAITMYDNITNEWYYNNTFSNTGTAQYLMQTEYNYLGNGIMTNVTNIAIEHNQPIMLNISVDNLTNPNGGTNLSFSFIGNTSGLQIYYSRISQMDTIPVLWNYSGQKLFTFNSQNISLTNLVSPNDDVMNLTSGILLANNTNSYSFMSYFSGTWKAGIGNYYTGGGSSTGNLTVNYTAGGTATGSNSTFTPPANLTINATNSTGFTFVNWTTNCNGAILNATNKNTRIQVNDNVSCYAQANFAPPALATISIVSPTATNYLNNTILVNISTTGASSTWFNWNGTNVSYAVPASVTFPNGTTLLFAYANNSAGTITSSFVIFTVNYIAPTLAETNNSINTLIIILVCVMLAAFFLITIAPDMPLGEMAGLIFVIVAAIGILLTFIR